MSELAQVLRHLLPVDDPDALVDASTGDDAAVYRLAADRALVVTTDFFSPIVDDPREFGRIAVANALSDVYAMGAQPLFALNLLGFPRDLLGEGLLEELVRGAGEACREAGIFVLGGHSVDDPEPKFGLVVVGEVHPDRLVRNAGARPGDALVLTKPLGSGVVSTAAKADAVDAALLERAIDVMAALNRGASEAMQEVGVHAATDVTGYGLLGHLRSLLRASGVGAEVAADAVPLLEGVQELVANGHVAGGTRRNLADLEPDVVFDADVPENVRILLADAQTSGGLLVAVAPDRLEALLTAMRGRSLVSAVVGRVVEARPGSVRVGTGGRDGE